MDPSLGTTVHGSLLIDVPRLIDTRLLVQSNSGGGKSWLLRRLLEQTAGKVQQIMLDTEGEFSTLRERFDYVICAPQGADAIATPSTAALLARRLRETRVSAIIDLYDLKMYDRRRFVRLFLEELIDAPKSMWHPALVAVDEAHLYCPEKGEAESASSVIDLSSRGRKRGLCALLATQRLSKLHKDAAAELLNKMIGRTGLDVDVKRAADELGMNPKEAIQTLRNLDPGEFYSFGPALTKSVTKVTIGPIETKHPKSGDRQISTPPAPSEKIKKILASLADLPKEAEQEARSLSELRTENSRLKRELTIAQKKDPRGPATEIKRIEVPVVGKRALSGLKDTEAVIRKTLTTMRAVSKSVDSCLNTMTVSLDKLALDLAKVSAPLPQIQIPKPIAIITARTPTDSTIGKCERAILTVLATHGPCYRQKLALLAGYTWSGSFQNSLGSLRALSFIVGSNADAIQITDAGITALGSHEPLPSGQGLRDYWLNRFGKCERAILQALFAHPEGLNKDQLCEMTGYSWSGSFQNSLGSLRTAGVLVGSNKGVMRASEELL